MLHPSVCRAGIVITIGLLSLRGSATQQLCPSGGLACFSRQVSGQFGKSCKRRVAVALVGAGHFAKKAHLPSLILDNKDCFDLRAVWSKSESSAKDLSGLAAGHGHVIPPVPLWGDRGWSEILAGKLELELVDVVLPIAAQHSFVKSALSAGLAVVSEKPVAPDVSQAESLLEASRASKAFSNLSRWFVCENWRFEPAFRVAELAISSGSIGQILAFSASSVTYMPHDVPYMNLHSWRMQEGSNWLADVAVHLAAAMHLLLGDIDVEGVVMRRVRPDIRPFDTFATSLRAGSLQAIPGVWLFSLSAPRFTPSEISGLSDLDLRITGTNGTLSVSRAKVELRDMSGRLVQSTAGLAGPSVAYALREVANSVLDLHPSENTSPEAALRDLRLVEALVKHAQRGQRGSESRCPSKVPCSES